MLLYLDSAASQAIFNFKYSVTVLLRISEAKTSCWHWMNLKSCKLSTPRSQKLLKTKDKRWSLSSRENKSKLLLPRRHLKGSWVNFCLKLYLFKLRAWTTILFTRTTSSIIIVHLSRTHLPKIMRKKRSSRVLVQLALYIKRKFSAH
jgi:hypothetical protein